MGDRDYPTASNRSAPTSPTFDNGAHLDGMWSGHRSSLERKRYRDSINERYHSQNSADDESADHQPEHDDQADHHGHPDLGLLPQRPRVRFLVEVE